MFGQQSDRLPISVRITLNEVFHGLYKQFLPGDIALVTDPRSAAPRSGSTQIAILVNMFLTFAEFGDNSSFAVVTPSMASFPAKLTSNCFCRSCPRPPKPSTRKLWNSSRFLPASYSFTCSILG